MGILQILQKYYKIVIINLFIILTKHDIIKIAHIKGVISMKKIISLCLIICILFGFSAYAKSYIISIDTIADGVVHKEYMLRSNAGTQKVNTLEIDLSNPRVSIKLLTDPEGVSYLENVKSMANSDERVIAAINGDFFAWYSKDKSRGSAVGLNFSKGEMLSSAPVEEDLASLVFTDSGAVLTQYFKPRMSVLTKSGRKEEIGTLNKFDSLAKLAMYNSHWGKSLYCDGVNQRVAVVEDDKIIKIISDEGEVEIPQNGYLLAGLADHTDFFTEGISVGETLKTELYFDPYFDDIETAIGGGTVLVKNGYKAKITHMRYGRDFRTAAGISKDGHTLYFITVDKRSESVGMTLSELQEFMLEIGVFDGLNLDGGGSTQMVARSYGDVSSGFLNKPENGYARPVTNALAVTVKGGERGKFEGITVKTDKSSLNIGETVTASFMPYDELYYPLETAPDITPEFTFSGVDGFMEGTSFTPTQKGTLKITVKYNGYKAEKKLNVFDPDRFMNADSVIYRGKSGEVLDVKVSAVTLSGKTRIVPLDEISISVTNDLATVSEGVITAKKSGFGVINFTCGDFSFSSYLSIDGIVPDDAFAEPVAFTDGFEDVNAYELSYPADTPSAYSISSEKMKAGESSGKLWFDFDTEIKDLQSAYVVFENPPDITRGNTQLSVDVYSPGFEKTLLKAMITGADGTLHRISLGNLKEKGWRTYSLTLPGNIALPAKLSRIYTVEGDALSKERGAIYLDNLSLVSGGSGVPENDPLLCEAFTPSVILTAGVTETDTLLSPIAAINVGKALEKATLSYSFTPLVSSQNTVKIQTGKVNSAGKVTLIQFESEEHLAENMEDAEKAVVITVNENFSSAKKSILGVAENFQSKDIFVVSTGNTPEVFIENGIHFVTLPALTPSILTNQKTFVTLELGTAKNKTAYNLRRIKLWN